MAVRASSFALILSLIAAACGGTAQPTATTAPTAAPTVAASAAPTPTPLVKGAIAVSHPTGGAHLPLFYGRDKGIYAKYGIDITLNPLGGGSPAVAALLANQVQVGDVTGSNVLAAQAQGADFVILGVLTPVYPYQLIGNDKIKTNADLKGQTIVIKAVGDATDVAVRLTLEKLGLVPDKDVTILAVNQDNARLSVLAAGQACCTPAQPRDAVPLLAMGGFHVIFDMAKLDVPNSQGAIVVTRKYYNENKQLLQQFIDATVESIATAKKDRPGSIEVIKKQLDLKDDTLAGIEYDYFMGTVVQTYPYATVVQFKAAQDLLAKTDAKVGTVDVAKMIDSSMLKDAEKRGVGK